MTQTFPRHIAIIMDGNGRWAKQRHLPRIAGHRAGEEAVKQAIKGCLEKKIEVLTLFAFSSENWQRPAQEVKHLMGLFLTALERDAKKLHKQNIKLRFIGDRTRFSEELQQHMFETEKLTANNTALTLVIAANYGGRWDVTEACKQMMKDVAEGKLNSSDVSESVLQRYLSLADLPEPDLFIRTSGEQRISNFLLWQLAYTEMYFTETLWPDFNEAELDKALSFFANRERRFGKTSEQMESQGYA